jgi:hypothetical protein
VTPPSAHAGGATLRLEAVQNAVEHARCVAERLTGTVRSYTAVPWFWTHQYARIRPVSRRGAMTTLSTTFSGGYRRVLFGHRLTPDHDASDFPYFFLGELPVSGFTTRPSDAIAARHRTAGIWRDSGPMDDLLRWRDKTPEAPVVWECRAGVPARRIGFARFADGVKRFAGALYELGVQPGDVVALQLPNRWETAALMLAPARLNAVLAPITTGERPEQLERMLARTRARVYVTMDWWREFDHAAAMRQMAPRLPRLQHRVVLGQARDAEIDFSSFFENTPWERHHPEAAFDAAGPGLRHLLHLRRIAGTEGRPAHLEHPSCRSGRMGRHRKPWPPRRDIHPS